jgi:hypothetical protein
MGIPLFILGINGCDINFGFDPGVGGLALIDVDLTTHPIKPPTYRTHHQVSNRERNV